MQQQWPPQPYQQQQPQQSYQYPPHLPYPQAPPQQHVYPSGQPYPARGYPLHAVHAQPTAPPIDSRLEALRKRVAKEAKPVAAAAPTHSVTKQDLVASLLERTGNAHPSSTVSKQELVDSLMERTGNLPKQFTLPTAKPSRAQVTPNQMVDASARRKIAELRLEAMKATPLPVARAVPSVLPRIAEMKQLVDERAHLKEALQRSQRRDEIEEGIHKVIARVSHFIDQNTDEPDSDGRASSQRRHGSAPSTAPSNRWSLKPDPSLKPASIPNVSIPPSRGASRAGSIEVAPDSFAPPEQHGDVQSAAAQHLPAPAPPPPIQVPQYQPEYQASEVDSDDSAFDSDWESVDSVQKEEKQNLNRLEHYLDSLNQPREQLSARGKLRAIFLAVLFPFAVKIPLWRRKRELDVDLVKEAEVIMYMGDNKLGAWLSSFLGLTMQSLINSKLELEIEQPRVGLWGRSNADEMETRAMQARVRVKRVIHGLKENLDSIPGSVLGMLRYIISLRVHFPKDYLLESEKYVLEKSENEINEWSCTSDAAAQFMIIKVIFLRGALYNMLVDEYLLIEAKRIRGAPGVLARKNLEIFGTLLYWLHIRAFENHIQPLQQVGDWREEEASGAAAEEPSRYWWNVVTDEVSWDDPPGKPSQTEADGLILHEIQASLKDQLLWDSCQDWMDGYAAELAEWSSTLLEQIKRMGEDESDVDARRSYWHVLDETPSSTPRSSIEEEQQAEEESPKADSASHKSPPGELQDDQYMSPKRHGSQSLPKSKRRASTLSSWQKLRQYSVADRNQDRRGSNITRSTRRSSKWSVRSPTRSSVAPSMAPSNGARVSRRSSRKSLWTNVLPHVRRSSMFTVGGDESRRPSMSSVMELDSLPNTPHHDPPGPDADGEEMNVPESQW